MMPLHRHGANIFKVAFMAAVLVTAACATGNEEEALPEASTPAEAAPARGLPTATEAPPTLAATQAPQTSPSGVSLPPSLFRTKPAQLPPFQALSLYSSQSPFNQRISPNAAVDPNSPAMVRGLSASGDTAFLLQVAQFSAPVYFADASTPRSDLELPCGEDWEVGVRRLRDVPIPPWAEPAQDVSSAARPPEGCGEESPQDNHMVVLDLAARCEYDLWQARREDGRWVASWGNAISLDSTGVYPKGMSSRGSGFAFLGGVIWPGELAAGRIDHALAFSYPYPRAGGPVAPATDSDGTKTQSFAIPEGARLQLDPSLNLDALEMTPVERTIARAMQEYGLYLVDSAGESGIALYAVDPRSVTGDPYRSLLPDEEFPTLAGIPLNRLRVLTLPPQDAGFRDNIGPERTACARYE